MSGAAAELFVRIAADASQYQNAIRNLPMPLQGVQAAGAAAAGGLNQAGRAAETAAEGMRHAATAADSVGGASRDAAGGLSRLAGAFAANLAADLAAHALMAAGAAMVDAGKRAVMLAGELEQSKVAFTTMLGSAAKADAFIRDLTSFAANTPFELRGLQDSAKKLLAFGFDARDIIPIMTSVGNAVSGLGGGKDVLDGVTLALGQMGAKGKASAEEMGQLAERGVPAWQFLADKIGKSIPEAMKMAEKGAISGATAIEAVVEGMNKKFPGMMAKQAQTLLGSWSNLVDNIDGLLTRLGGKFVSAFNLTGIIQGATAGIGALIAFIDAGGLDASLDVIAAAALGVGTAIAVVAVPAAVAAIQTSLIPAIQALALAWAPALLAAAPYVALAAAVAAAAYPVIRQWDEVKSATAAVWDLIVAKATEAWQTLRTVGAQGVDALAAAWDALTAPVARVWAAVVEASGAAWGAITRTVESWASWFTGNLRQIASAAQAMWGLVVAVAVEAWQAISTTVKGWYSWFVGIGGKIVGAAGAVWSAVGAAASRWYDGLRQLAAPVLGVFSAMWGGAEKLALGWLKTVLGLGQRVVDVFRAVAANIGAILGPVFKSVGGMLGKAVDMLPAGVKGNLASAADEFRNFVGVAGAIVAPMPQMMAGNVAAAAGTLTSMIPSASSAFAGLQSLAQTAGANFVATWGGAAKDFTDATAAMWGKSTASAAAGAAAQGLHLAKTAAAADKAGKAHKAAATEAEKAAKRVAAAWDKELMARAAAEAVAFAKALQGVGAAVSAVQAFQGLKTALGEIETRAAAGVAGFDRYAARAAALRDTMADLKAAGIAPTAPAMVALAKAIGQADAASGRFQAGQKELGDTFETLSASLDANAARAEAFGLSYNQAEADIASMETALDKLLTAKVKNADAIEYLTKQLAAARGPFGQAAKLAGDFRKTLGEFRSPLSDLESGLKTVGETLGVDLGAGLAGATLKAADFAQGVGGIVGGTAQMATFMTATAIPALAGFAAFLTATAIPAVLAAIPTIGVGLTTAFGAMAVAVNAAIWPVALIAAGIAGAIIAGQALYENWDAIGAAIKPIWDGIAGAAGAAFGAVAGFVVGAGQFIAAPFVAAWQAVAGVLGPIWDGIASAGSAAFNALGEALGTMALGLAPIWDGIIGVIKGGVNVLVAVINTLIRGINNMSRISVPDWVPGIGGRSWGGFNLPEVPYLAAGGVTTGPAMAMIGEGRYQEAVLPLSRETFQQIAAGIKNAGGRSGGGAAGGAGSTTVINLHVNYNGSGKWTRQDADALGPLLVGQLRAAGLGR